MISNSEVPNMEITPRKTRINYAKLESSKVLFHKGANDRRIFHYTSVGGLQGILEHKTLRFTNIHYMNDKDEIFAGLDSMAKELGASNEEKKKFHSAFLSQEKQTFVCCFSIEEDSLPMWNYYTKEINNQGYNIEFNDKKLVESILRSNPTLDGCDISFGIVDYSKDNDSAYGRTIISNVPMTILLSFAKLFLTVVEGEDSNNKDAASNLSLQEVEKLMEDNQKRLNALPIYFYNGETCSFAKDSTGDYLYFIKRDYFKQEREFRIVITVPNERLVELKEAGVYKFQMRNSILVPFLELRFSAESVKGIMISPTVQSDLVEISIRDFLEYCNFNVADYSQFIRHSKVPVRF